jgi:hypothetical protein
VSTERKRARVKEIQLYMDDNVFLMQDGQKFALQAVLMSPHHALKPLRLFCGGDAQQALYAASKSVRISRPPGCRLRELADFFCAPKTMERVVLPILADLQTEYFDALAQGRTSKAWVIRLRGYGSFWMALSLYKVAKRLKEIWRISRLG